MGRHARTTTVRRRLARALVVNLVTLPAAGAIGYAGGHVVVTPFLDIERPVRAAAPDPRRRAITALEQRYDCSRSGLGPGVVPARTIVLDERGTVEVVAFDVGWSMYEGRRPGTLVSVCRR
jgi:hypothetical protein